MNYLFGLRGRSVFLILLSFGINSVAKGGTSPFDSQTVPGLQLSSPARGSIAGEYGKTTWSASDLSRGSYSIPIGMTFPEARGPQIYPMSPQYSPGAGLSEWGLGVSWDLSIRRFRTSGSLDFKSDDLLSPWGQLTRGSDGAYYPIGLKTKVKVKFIQENEIHAYLSDGSTFIFGRDQILNTPAGIYSWYLVEATNSSLQSSSFSYEKSENNYFYLHEVRYGGSGTDYQYKISLEYKPIENSFIDFRSTVKQVLEKSIANVILSVKTGGNSFSEHYRYRLTHEISDLGPAFHLTSIQKYYVSQSSDPARTFTYQSSLDTLAKARWKTAKKLLPAIESFGTNFFSPDRGTQVDLDANGLVGMEIPKRDYAVLQQTETGYEMVPTARDPNIFDPCRNSFGDNNAARRLVRLRGINAAPEVILTQYLIHKGKTRLVVCSREGKLKEDLEIPGEWELGPLTQLIDLNRNGKPDLIRFDRANYRILKNLSNDLKIEFSTEAIPGRLNDDKGLTPLKGDPSQFIVQDLNGDGIVDIIGQFPHGFFVWFGKGNYQFETTPTLYPVYRYSETGVTKLVDFDDAENQNFIFQDLNGDGIADLMVAQEGSLYLYFSDGKKFIERRPPAFSTAPSATCPFSSFSVIPGDFQGTGNAQILGICRREAYAFEFTSPDVGLLKSSSDGKGNQLTFTYERAAPEKNIGIRMAVIRKLEIKSGGKAPQSSLYTFAGSVTHSANRSLLGFKDIISLTSSNRIESQFFQDDQTPPTFISSRDLDPRLPSLSKIAKNEYESTLFRGIPYLRLKNESHGYSSVNNSLVSAKEKEYLAYLNDFCPSEFKETLQKQSLTTRIQYSQAANLSEHLTCFTSQMELIGTHSEPNSGSDFDYNLGIERDLYGHPLRLTSGGTFPRVLQEIQYRPDFRPALIRVPGKGNTSFNYDELYRLKGISRPDGVNLESQYSTFDLMQALVTHHGDSTAGTYTENFGYDTFDRLAQQWNNIFPSSLANPLKQLRYNYGSDLTPAWIQAKSRYLMPNQDIWRTEFQFQSTDGEDIGSTTQADSGWIAKNLKYKDPDETLVSQLGNHFVSLDPELLKYDDLFGDKGHVQSTQTSGFGFEWLTNQTYQNHQTGDATSSTELSIDRIIHKRTENSKYITEQQEDLDGHTMSHKDAVGNSTEFKYDALGRLISAQLPNGDLHQSQFDDQGRLKTVTRSHLGKILYFYKTGTDLLEEKHYIGNNEKLIRKVIFEYDTAGRILIQKQLAYLDGAFFPKSASYQYFYDGFVPGGEKLKNQIGFLTTIQGPDFTRIQAFGLDGKLTQVETRFPNWKNVVQTFKYQPDGTAQSKFIEYRNYPLNFVETGVRVEQKIELDILGRPHQFYVNGASFASLSYNSLSQLEKVDLPLGDQVSYEYDELTWHLKGFKGIQKAKSFVNTWEFSSRGLIDSESLAFGNQSISRKYQYHDNATLSADSDAKNSRSYEYNANSMLTSFNNNGSLTLLNQEGAAVPFAVDSLARLIKRNTSSYSYGPSGRIEDLAQVGKPTVTYSYDETGKRILKKIAGRVVEAYLDDIVLTDGKIYQPIRINGTLIGMLENDKFSAIPLDARGSVLQDKAGNPDFISPYGERAGERPESAKALDYVSQGYDPDLQAYRMEQRDYDPLLKRFHTADPLFLENPEKCLESPIECNLYGYAKGNPVSFVDPTGKQAGDVWLYQSDGGGPAQFVSRVERNILHRSDTTIYTHASVELSNGNQYTAHTNYGDGRSGWSLIDNRNDILTNWNGNSPRSIDVFRHTESDSANVQMLDAVAKIQSGESGRGIFGLGVCSTATAEGLRAADLKLDFSVLSTPQNLSHDSHLGHVGSYNTGAQRSELPSWSLEIRK